LTWAKALLPGRGSKASSQRRADARLRAGGRHGLRKHGTLVAARDHVWEDAAELQPACLRVNRHGCREATAVVVSRPGVEGCRSEDRCGA
jgi:hypothetical protein